MPSRIVSSRLTRALFLFAYSALVIFGSLYPFSDWQFSQTEAAAIFFPSQPRYITRTDILTNVLAYFPLGVFALLYFHAAAPLNRSLLRALLFAGGLSFAMELIQLGIASRHSSPVDWFTNMLGAMLGALVAAFSIAQPKLLKTISTIRRRWFLPGALTSIGIGILALGLLAELRPLPQVTNTVLQYEHLLQFALTGASFGLLIVLLVPPRAALPAASLIILVIIFLRAATTLLLYKFNLSRLLPWEPLLGTAAALVVALLTLRAKPRDYKYLAGISVLLLLLFVQFRSWVGQGKAGNIFGYWELKGSMFNFTGATHALSEIWPLLALFYLLGFYLFEKKKA